MLSTFKSFFTLSVVNIQVIFCFELKFIDSLPDALEELAAVEAGEAGPPRGDVHPGHVVHRTEHADLVVDAAVRLHALEQLLHTISYKRI